MNRNIGMAPCERLDAATNISYCLILKNSRGTAIEASPIRTPQRRTSNKASPTTVNARKNLFIAPSLDDHTEHIQSG